jgi:hypothetical protein
MRGGPALRNGHFRIINLSDALMVDRANSYWVKQRKE